MTSPSKKYSVVCGIIKPDGTEIKILPEIVEVSPESKGVTFDRAKQTAIEYLAEALDRIEELDESTYRR